MKNLTEFLKSNCELQEEEMKQVNGGDGGNVTYVLSSSLASMAISQLYANTWEPADAYGFDPLG